MAFTFEFLPHFASGIERKADFSFYEVKWNSYGKWGHFEFQCNSSHLFQFSRDLELPTMKKVFIVDFTLREADERWDFPRLGLYEQFKGKVLTELPNGIYLKPEDFLLIRLRLQFSKEERKEIARQLHFIFPSEDAKRIYYDDDFDIANIISQYPIKL